ncbi:MAG: CehA/McbA family metallohydrolase [Myxococcota bacterium]|nr:CehA/McbA family metallohydrolase [Myxococcota bacterium]
MLLAQQIDDRTPPSLIPQGPDAIGGLGDWLLSNGLVCATISDVSHEAFLSASGGVLVDLSHCGRADDQWSALQSMLNLSREQVLNVERVRAQVDRDEASLITEASADGLSVVTTYSLAPAPSRVLRMETRVRRTREGDAFFFMGDLTIHGHRQVTPFAISAQLPGGGSGFDHPDISISSPLAMADAMIRADLQVLVGVPDGVPGIAYGWQMVEAYVERADGQREPVLHLAMHGEHFSMLATYTDTLWLEGTPNPNLLELAQTLFMDLEKGEELVQVREIRLSDVADVASVTDALWAEGRWVQGETDRPGMALHVRRANGDPVTFVRPPAAGPFRFKLPPGAVGDFVIEAVSPNGHQTRQAFSVAAEAEEIQLVPLFLPRPGRVRLPVGEPVRLVFEGIDPTPDPSFGSDGTHFRVGGDYLPGSSEASSVSLSGSALDPLELSMPAGRYRVLLTRGLEWSHAELELEVVEGEAIEPVWPTLEKQVDMPGWVSADLHVHSGLSDDSSLGTHERLRTFVAEGALVMVATEHDQLSDYQSLIEASGLQDRVVAVGGVELTSGAQTPEVPSTAGHANAFPIPYDPSAYRDGAPRAENQRLRETLTQLSRLPAPPVVQLNHPREAGFDSGMGAYFTHLSQAGDGLDPALPLSDPQNRSLIEPLGPDGLRDVDFHAIELFNGPSMIRYRLVRADWFSLMLQGEPRTGTANSDSHSLAEIVALPRNYLALRSGPLPDFDQAGFLDAVRAGKLFGTSGPLIEATIGGKGPGEMVSGEAGILELRVQAADWVPVHEVRVFVDGRLETQQAVGRNESLEIPLKFTQDGFVVVEVEGRAEPGSVYSRLAPGFTPFAFTNPIRVDAQGDGRWEPPGLSSPLPPSIVDPLAGH